MKVNFINWLNAKAGRREQLARHFNIAKVSVKKWRTKIPDSRVDELCKITGMSRDKLLESDDSENLQVDFNDWFSQNPEKIEKLTKLVCRSRRTVAHWRRNRVPVAHVEVVSKFTGIPVNILRYGRIQRVDTGVYGGSAIPLFGFRAKDLELWRARSANLPASLDNELMGTPPPGRSVWDQTKAIRGPDGRLLDQIEPLNISGIFDRITNIPRNENRTEHAPLQN